MPTGYTQIILNNPTMPLNKWALHCARAFGACITMRDDDPDLPAPKKFKPELSYHRKSLRKAHATIRKLEKMTPEQREAYNKKKKAKVKKLYTVELKHAQEEQKVLDNMKAQIEAWNPSSEYFEIKNFMLKQLEMSTPYTSYYVDNLATVDKTDFWEEDFNTAKRNIKYHTERIDNEIATVKKRNEWLGGLYKSLPKSLV